MNGLYDAFHRSECAIIHRADAEFGALGNMAGGFPIALPGIGVVGSSEALFQALRFPGWPDLQQEILAQPSGYGAKCMARKEGRRENLSREDWKSVCIGIMRYCVEAKFAQHSAVLHSLLRHTENQTIVEQTRTAHGQFWGAKPLRDADWLEGTNHLGRLWMDIRASLRAQEAAAWHVVNPPDTPNLRLLGKPLGVLSVSPASVSPWQVVEHLTPAADGDSNARAVWTHPQIPGLLCIPEFLSSEAQDAIIACIDRQPWSTELSRRVQHYGAQYDYQIRRIVPEMRLGPLPDWLACLGARLEAESLLPERPDQVICNEYLPGQGISDHIDCQPCFKGAIASLSLGSPCVMNFTHPKNGTVIPVLLEPGSLLVLQDQARHTWKHGIAKRKSDVLSDRTLLRERRLSLTFRILK